MASPARRLESIDMLRGVAVLAVVLAHLPFSKTMNPSAPDVSGAHSALPAWITNVTDWGSHGVNLFLLISGFCIHLSAARGAQVAFKAFWWRRMRRLYPPYVAAVAVTLLGLLFYHGVVRGQHHSLHQAIGYASAKRCLLDLGSLVLQLQNITGAGARIGNSPLWTLALEEQLYMLYFVLLALRSRFSWKVVLGIVLVVTVGWRAVAIGGWMSGFWLDLGPARWLEWALGACAAELYVRHSEPVPSFASGIVLVPAGLLAAFVSVGVQGVMSRLIGDMVVGYALFLLVVRLTRANAGPSWHGGKIVRAFAALGVFSYSVYLTHSPLLFLGKQLGMRAHLGVVAILALRLGLALAIGFVFFRVVERRFLSQPAAPEAAPVPVLS